MGKQLVKNQAAIMFTGLLAASVVFFSGTAAIAAETGKVAIVDIEKAIKQTSAGVKMEKELKAEFEKKKADFSKREADLRKKFEEYDKKKNLFSEEARQKKTEEFQREQMSFQKEVAESQGSIQKKSASCLSRLPRKWKRSLRKWRKMVVIPQFLIAALFFGVRRLLTLQTTS